MNSVRERGFFSLADEPMVTGSIDCLLAKLNFTTKLKKRRAKVMKELYQEVSKLKKGFDNLGGGTGDGSMCPIVDEVCERPGL